MKIIGLIGGIASGKSTVAAGLHSLGAAVLDADATVRGFLGTVEVARLVANRWGADILDEAGTPRRGAIAGKIFAPTAEGAAERRWLESVLHPLVRRKHEAEIARLRATECPAVVIDAPLLLEAGWGPMCDELVWVECPESARRQRAAARGWPVGEFERREAAQLPLDEKRRLATWTIESSGDLEGMQRQVDRFWAERIANPKVHLP